MRWALGTTAALALLGAVLAVAVTRDRGVPEIGLQEGVLQDVPPASGEARAAAPEAEDPDVEDPDGGPAPEEAEPRREAVRRIGAIVERRTQMRASPGGKVVSTVTPETPFGGQTALAVVAREGDWLAVLHHSYGVGRKAGWIRADAVRLEQRPYEIVINRSELRATLLHEGKFVMQWKVGVGREGNPTPVGRYSATDLLEPQPGSPYGCCIIALSGRQPNLPQGWSGGDRLALHGGPEWRVGIRTTSGCVTVPDRVLVKLMRRVAPGSRVTVQA